MSTQTPTLSTSPSVAAQIARLPEMPMAEIKALWQKLVGGDTPTHNRQFLERRLAYRLQEVEFRKVDANLLERNQRRIASLVETGKVKKRDRDYRPAAGGLFAHAEIVGRASQFDSNNQNEARRAFHLYNASLGYAWREWTFTLWGKNLLNTRYEKRVFFFGNEDPNYVETRYEDRADPRQLGVSASYRF